MTTLKETTVDTNPDKNYAGSNMPEFLLTRPQFVVMISVTLQCLQGCALRKIEGCPVL